MAYLCEKLGYRLIEIPIHFEDRRIGQSKLDIPVKIESAWRTWQIRWRYRELEASHATACRVLPGVRSREHERQGEGGWRRVAAPAWTPRML